MAVFSARELARVQEEKTPEPVLDNAPEPLVKAKKPRPEDNWFVLEHPDFSPSNRVTCEFEIVAGDETYKVKLEQGRIETQITEVKDILVARGYRFMNEEF